MNNQNKENLLTVGVVIVVVVIFLIGPILTLVFPSESHALHVLGEEVNTKMTLRTDFINPENKDSFVEQRVGINFKKGDLSLGGIVKLVPEKDYLRLRPYVALDVGPVTPVIGLSTDSNGVDHVNAGIWYFRKISDDLSLFADIRNFWGLNNDSVDFSDNFLALSLKLNEKVFSGLDLIYDHYWKSSNDWFKIGVPLGYKATDKITVFVRPGFDRFLPEEGNNTDTYSFRIGMNITF